MSRDGRAPPAGHGATACPSTQIPGGLHRVLVVLLLVVGLGLRLRIAWMDHRHLIGHLLWSDDSFLCLSIARNLAHGLGMTCDGAHLTNGFQPLYVFLLVPIFWLVDSADRIAPIHWAGTLQAILATAAGWLYYCIACRAFGRAAAGFVLFFWAVSHYFVVVESNGMETALYGLTLGLLIWFYLARFVQTRAPRPFDYAGLGLMAALAMLARMDAVCLVLAVGLDLLWRGRHRLRERTVGLATAAGVGLAALSPWLAACLAVRGTIVPDSGPAVRFISARMGFVDRTNYFRYTGPDGFDPQDAPWQYAAENVLTSAALWAALTPLTSWLQGTETTHIYNFDWRFPAGRLLAGIPWMSLAAVFLLVAAWLTYPIWRAAVGTRLGGLAPPGAQTRRPARARGSTLIDASAAGAAHQAGSLDFLRLPVLLWAAAYSFYVYGSWYFPRYYYPVILILTIFSGWLLEAAVRVVTRPAPRIRRPLRVILAGAFGLVFYCQMAHHFTSDASEIERGKYHSVLPWLEANLPRDARLGSFQSGVLGYFAPQTCVNLDGVVNHDALVAMRQRRLWSYILQQRIDYLVDWSLCIDRYLRPTAGVDPVPIEPVYTETTMKVHRVRR